MTIPVFVEPTSRGYRASTGSPLMLSAEAATADMAMDNLRQLYWEKMKSGGEIREIAVSKSKNDTIREAAMAMSQIPLLKEWQAAREEYRREQERLEQIDSP